MRTLNKNLYLKKLCPPCTKWQLVNNYLHHTSRYVFLLIEFIYTYQESGNRDSPNEFLKRFSKFN